jgi:hypothetical protein
MVVLINFPQLELQQADVNYVSRYARDLHTISNSDSQLSDQQEVANNRKNHILERNRNPRREKS